MLRSCGLRSYALQAELLDAADRLLDRIVAGIRSIDARKAEKMSGVFRLHSATCSLGMNAARNGSPMNTAENDAEVDARLRGTAGCHVQFPFSIGLVEYGSDLNDGTVHR